VIVADPGREGASALRLGRIGFDHVAGYLRDGLRSLESRPDLTATTERLAPPLAWERLATGRALAIDVRTPREQSEKTIAGSISVPLNQLLDRLGEIPGNRPLLLYCAGGYRSSIAASLLAREGFTQIGEIAGGLAAWETANLPLHA